MTDSTQPIVQFLQRFVAAQDAGGTYDRAAAELRAGRKASHWMWFVFPQIAGLGYSPTARSYAITSLAEARAYLAHPVLGPRLRQSAHVLTELGAALRRAGQRSAAQSPLREALQLALQNDRFS